MLTEPQRQTFESRGVLKLEQAVPEDIIGRAREPVLRALTKLGCYRDGEWILDAEKLPSPKELRRVIKSISEANVYDRVVTEGLRDTISGLLDNQPISEMIDRAQLLFTWPNADEWTVPHNVWHLDLPRVGDGGTPGVQVFVFLEKVEHGGGGTLVVSGSHRLTIGKGAKLNSKQLKKHVKREDFFRQLWSKSTPNRDEFQNVVGEVDGIDMQVIEMTGEPGDVYLMDMRSFHAPAPNAGARPRMMLTQRLAREDLLADWFAEMNEKEIQGA